ncbi:MAG: hypothetical protein ABFS56_01100 [Pseudomonadota bacterium]
MSAIGEGRTWNPYHAKDDLLWVRWEPSNTFSSDKPSMTLGSASKFSVSSMLSFIGIFQEKNRLTDEEGMSILGMKNADYYAKYRNFLLAGNFLEQRKQFFIKTEQLEQLWEALKNGENSLIRKLLCCVQTFAEFIGNLKVGYPLTSKAISAVSHSAFPTYCALAEISCAGLYLSGEGICATSFYPELKAFSEIAVKSYQTLAKGEKYILTGLWLETLAKEYGIHPIIARNRLNEAQKAGLLERYTEGSTPETQFEKHTMHYLTVDNGVPVIQKVKLYRGDFVIPDRASVSIRIEGKQ